MFAHNFKTMKFRQIMLETRTKYFEVAFQQHIAQTSSFRNLKVTGI